VIEARVLFVADAMEDLTAQHIHKNALLMDEARRLSEITAALNTTRTDIVFWWLQSGKLRTFRYKRYVDMLSARWWS